MIKNIKYIPLFIFIVLGSVFNNLNAQNFIGSLNDSIIKYKLGEPTKSTRIWFFGS
jgi:hypothetical protein